MIHCFNLCCNAKAMNMELFILWGSFMIFFKIILHRMIQTFEVVGMCIWLELFMSYVASVNTFALREKRYIIHSREKYSNLAFLVEIWIRSTIWSSWNLNLKCSIFFKTQSVVLLLWINELCKEKKKFYWNFLFHFSNNSSN